MFRGDPRGRWGGLRILYRYYLVLVGLDTSHLEFLGDVPANGGPESKDVSGHGEGQLALHEVVFQFRQKPLIFGVGVVSVLRVGPRAAGAGGGCLRRWRWH